MKYTTIELLCVDDTQEVPRGFIDWILGREKTRVKDERLTKDKKYDILDVRQSTYGSAYVNYTFTHYLILADTGARQLIPEANFQLVVKE